MAQHFLLTAKARSIRLSDVFRMDETTAHSEFMKMRWPQTDGKPYCPRCGCLESYAIKTRRRFKCMGCHHQYSVTSGTIFAGRKLPFASLLAAIVIFVNGVKGVAALHLSRELHVQYKTAFVLTHKLREAMAREFADRKLDGTVEVDGAYFGGYVKPANEKANRKDLRLLENRSGKRQVVVIMRERRGRSLSYVSSSEAESVPIIRERVEKEAIVLADESSAWDRLNAHYTTHRVNHSKHYKNVNASTNWAESYFSRLRRAEIGTHHHIAGPYLAAYATEMTWREDNRAMSNGTQTEMIGMASLAASQSRQWKGYWQRRKAP